MGATKGTKKAPSKQKRKAEAAIVQVVTPTPGAPLTKAEHTLLAEALSRAEHTRNAMEDALLDFGRWLLVHVFADDTRAALEGRRDNAVWRVLLDRAGGPTLRLTPRFLHVAVKIAAQDRRIQDESWRLLDAGRKELLLPLDEAAVIRKAAQHVVAMKLSFEKTQAHVRALLAARGEEKQVRVTAPRFSAQVRRFRERVTEPRFKRKLQQTLAALEPDKRKQVKGELEALRAWLTDVIDVVT